MDDMTSTKLKNQYDDVDVDDLLEQLSPEELELLAKEVDPDVSRPVYYHYCIHSPDNAAAAAAAAAA